MSMTREEALIILQNCLDYENGEKCIYPIFPIERFAKALKTAIEALKEQRPHGEWEKVGEMTYKCNRCGWLKKTGLMPYCENCGTDMRKRGDVDG